MAGETSSDAWKDLFDARSTSLCGYVTSSTKLDRLLQEYEYATSSRFRCLRSSKQFGKDLDEGKVDKSLIRFVDTQENAKPHIEYDGIPLIIMGKKVMECHQGHDRDRNSNKKKQLKAREDSDHTYKPKRRLVQNSKKKACPVRIKIRHVVKFLSYSLSSEEKTPHQKKKLVRNLKEDLKNSPAENIEHRFYVQFPEVEDHRNHLKAEASSILQPMDKRLSDYINRVVIEHGVTSTLKMKLLLEVFLRQSIFINASLPPRHNKRFWSSLKDIYNHMAAQFLKLRDSRVDQKLVVEMVEEQRSLHPNEKFYIRIKKDQEPDHDIDVPDENVFLDEDFMIRNDRQNVGVHKFLYVHQTPWQRQLLKRYGNEICLLDATYRTTKYSLPLYFLCVPTNVNYMTVATFILETEDSFSIQEALSVIKAWNPDWKPAYFMCDYAEEEINSIESVFPDAFVYLCDFHREQAWERWLKASHNGVGKDKVEILRLLRSIARSKSVEEFELAKSKLQESHFWEDNNRFRRWFEGRWLNKHKRWVQAFRQKRFNTSVNTNNGVERQNKSLKYEYLDTKKAKSLCHLLTVMWNDFLPDTYQRYVRQNLSAAEEAKTYSANIPDFLRNRPKNVVKHCFTRWEESINIPANDIDQVGDGHFLVKSQNPGSSEVYSVNFFSTEFPVPSCDCDDWARHHMVCKHFSAIFRHMNGWHWEQLPAEYRNNPFLTLDKDVLLEYNSFPVQERKEESNRLDKQAQKETAIKEQSNIREISLPSKSKLSKLHSNISSYCQIIKDYAYNCKDNGILQEICQNLHVNVDVLKRNLSQETDSTEFILDNPEKKMTHIATANINRLSLSKRKKKGAGRHGVSAEKMKYHYSSKGIDDLMTESNEERCVDEEVITIEDDDEYMHIPESKACHTTGFGAEEDTITACRLVQKLWSMPSDYHIPVAKVDGRNITDTDIRSLRPGQWLTDVIMDSYISLLAVAQNDMYKKVLHYDTLKMTSIIEGTFVRPQTSKEMKIEELDADIVVGTYHRSGHWTLVVVEMKQGKIYFYNPCGERPAEMKKIERRWRKYVEDVEVACGVQFPLRTWSVTNTAHSKQKDSFNCGIYCFIFAEKHMTNKLCDLQSITGNELEETRRSVAEHIMLYEGKN
ncbi:uncharacterized protein LOC130051290 [Ostrea edulis]|uniref:uncharacterized protein LOC130051290 n=1 Tax=Ostrea edulis TaxID=37623 RepID=UPI0024AEEA8A|nr:uncharacterized protein LOC130051290 [Ostrea edulis]